MKHGRFFPFAICCLLPILGLLSGCANVIAPVGGPKDEVPPAVVPEGSTPNFQTRFQRQRILLTFDEWVQVAEVAKQVVVSPPLEHPFEITLKGRTLRFDFDEREVLRDSATYTINFGEAVTDLTERNPAKDLRFVFSTGDQIDSLSFQGTLVDALTGEPVDGALFMLYDNLADSVVRTQKPFYFGRSNKEGRFKIENIKAGVFKGLALVDSDFNYLFNFKTERIGFPDSLIRIPFDTTGGLTIKLFSEEIPIQIKDSELRSYGTAKVVFNRVPEGMNLRYDPPGAVVYKAEDADSLRLWYRPDDSTALRAIYLEADTTFSDTLYVNPATKESFLKTAKLRDADARSAGSLLKVNPGKAFRIQFTHPLATIDTARLAVYEDTTRIRIPARIGINDSVPNELLIGWQWKEGKRYEMELLPGAVRDWYGLSNDSILKKWIVEPVKSFGNIKLTIEGLDPGLNYVATLLFQENNVVENLNITNVKTFQRNFTLLPPGNYSVRIVTDLNRNGRWDAGLYDAKRQPEPIFKAKLEPLRANWDLETKVMVE
ncbi:MAG: Ig-like domain-containing protein [Saprospiraceae bacterium]|nr:Ig-like domain-containing protein [Saprospiraceae bacterium]